MLIFARAFVVWLKPMISSRVKWTCPGCKQRAWGKSLGACHCGLPSVATTGECFTCSRSLDSTREYKYRGRGLCSTCDSTDRMLYTRGPVHDLDCCTSCWFKITGEAVKIWS